MPTRYYVCKIDDLQGKTTGVELETPKGLIKIIVLKLNDKITAFINQCPHTGVNLEWRAHQFLDSSGNLLQCATHGALFEIVTGECIQGPCHGQSLQSVHIEIDTSEIYINL